MKNSRKNVRQRNILTVEPLVTLPLIKAELNARSKAKQKGALRRMIEEAIYFYVGPKHPKLMAGIDGERLMAKGNA